MVDSLNVNLPISAAANRKPLRSSPPYVPDSILQASTASRPLFADSLDHSRGQPYTRFDRSSKYWPVTALSSAGNPWPQLAVAHLEVY